MNFLFCSTLHPMILPQSVLCLCFHSTFRHFSSLSGGSLCERLAILGVSAFHMFVNLRSFPQLLVSGVSPLWLV